MLWSIVRVFGCQFVKNSLGNAAISRVSSTRVATDTSWPHSPKQVTRRFSSVTNMASSTLSTDKVPEDYRLPLDVRPTHYDVTIWTDLDKEIFNGFVKIEYVYRLFTS
jgi:hypothetical protein